MDALTLTAEPLRSEVLSGESLVVRATLENGTPFAIDFVSSPSPVAYTLRDGDRDGSAGEAGEPRDGRGAAATGGADPGGGARSPRQVALSAVAYKSAMSPPNPQPPIPPLHERLRAGERWQVREDLAIYAIDPLAPGRYALAAAFASGGTTARSEGTALTVLRHRPGLLRHALCPFERALFSVADGQDGDGRALVLLRATDGDSFEGAAFRRAASDLAAPVGAVAVAVGSWGRGIARRWVGWIAGGAFAAAQLRAALVTARAAPVPLDLEDATLVHPALQRPDGTALFIALGERRGSPAAIAIEIAADGSAQARPSAPLPRRIPADARARYAGLGADGQVRLVFAEARGEDGARIVALDLGLDGGARGDLVPLAEQPWPLLALACMCDPKLDRGRARALFGPEVIVREDGSEARSLLLVTLDADRRASADPPGEPAVERLPLPEETEGPPARAYAVADGPHGHQPVAALVGPHLRAFDRRAGEWFVVDEVDPRSERLALLCASTSDRTWAVWLDPRSGMRHVEL